MSKKKKQPAGRPTQAAANARAAAFAKQQKKKPNQQKEAEKETARYLAQIQKQQDKEAQRYQKLFQNQQDAFSFQLAAQQMGLDRQLAGIAQQSEGQMSAYESLLTRITQQQEYELGNMRSMFDQQNLESESVISRLQGDIERLSKINKPPSIDVDTRAGIVGISQFQQASQKRQQRGVTGGRRAAPIKADDGLRTSTLGLDIAY